MTQTSVPENICLEPISPVDFWQLLVVILVVVLVPVGPAYLLYRTLPANARVSGPLKGLNLNLEGAFAGYFSLFLALGVLIKSLAGPIEIWHIKGKVHFDTGEGIKPETAQITIVPSAKIEPDGTFEMNVARQVDSSGVKRFPLIILELPNPSNKQEEKLYQPAVLHPSDNLDEVEYVDRERTSTWRKTIAFKPVTITKFGQQVPKYASTSPAPTQLTSPPPPNSSTP